MELSLRMRAIADLAKGADIVADIGCDHGFVTAALIEDNGAKRVIACDISGKSLQKAKDLAWERGLEDQVAFYVADGMEALAAQPIDCIVIAGMGGLLIRDILKKEAGIARRSKRLVLAPQGNEYELRVFLYENGFVIRDESIVKDEGRFYQVIVAESGNGRFPEEVFLRYGSFPVKRGEPLQKEFLQRRLREFEAIIERARRGKGTDCYIGKKQELCERIREVIQCL